MEDYGHGEDFILAESTLSEDNWIEVDEIREGEYIKGSYNVTLYLENKASYLPPFPDTIRFTNGTFVVPLQ